MDMAINEYWIILSFYSVFEKPIGEISYIYIYLYISKNKNTLIFYKYFGCFQKLHTV